MGKVQYVHIILRMLLIIVNGITIYYFLKTDYLITSIGITLLLLLQIILFLDYLNKQFTDIEKTIDCLLHDDFSNTITKRHSSSVNIKASKLLTKRRKENLQRASETVIFTNIIESLSIGILILRKGSNNNIEIFQINKAFTEFLKIPKFYNWHILEDKIQSLSKLISEWKYMKHVVSLNINEETENFFLKTSVTQTNNYQYLIVSLETIQQLIDKKEKEAWYKLMNVMSHEIINTITPISSLAESLESLLHEDSIDNDNLDEVSTGLQIIKKRSHHLTSFVETYRQLAELPLPQKEITNLSSLISSTLNLFDQEFKTKKIKTNFKSDSTIEVTIDKKQIEQVIINLISNSLYALDGIESPTLTISIQKVNTKTQVLIKDNGIGIPAEIKDNIFIPYFTTRKNGSGIGLTLTKSIMETHNGNIHFKSNNKDTTFILTFN